MVAIQLLSDGLKEMGLSVNAEMQVKLLAYMTLLQKWNKVYNLTAIREPSEMVTLHLLDSLSVMPYIKTSNLLDVGSGGGLPGVVLAIVKPDLQVTTIDTVQKKAIFMRQAKAELGLSNLTVVHNRVENFEAEAKFEAIISRAFSDLSLFIRLTSHLITEKGVWLAMKGLVPEAEINALNRKPDEIIPLKIAGLDAQRHLLRFNNTNIKSMGS